jgi:succinoglycan biosynthesis transport protein ExoP
MQPMQPTPESYSIPRRPMDVEDYIDVLRRHKGWIIGPAFAALVISVVVAFFWPDTYISLATIRIVPPQVPERYVASNINAQLSQRIGAMAESVLSRPSLSDMITAYNLYPRKRNRVPMEDVIHDMRQDIKINPIYTLQDPGGNRAPYSAFTVGFAYHDKYLARKITDEMVTRLVNESLTTRADQSKMTTRFLEDQLTQSKRKLDAIESKLTDYKLRNAGRLPEQLNGNYQQLRTLETQLASVNGAISRVSQEKLDLESQLRLAKEQQQAFQSSPPAETAAKNERLVQLERQILSLETLLTGLRQQYTETHPDVRRTEAQLEAAKRNRDSLIKEQEKEMAEGPKKKERAPALNTPQALQVQAAIEKLQNLIRSKDAEMEQYVKEQARIDKAIRQFQQRIEASPFAEREYIELTRDYDLAKKRYDDLSLKRSQSELASDLETRKQGEILEILEPASLPQTPTEPKRWLWVSIGSSLGLMLGLFLAGGREMKDTSLKNLKDVKAYTGLSVLGSVPLLENDLVMRRKRRLTWLAWSTACIFGFLIMAGSIYYYYVKGTLGQ